MDGSTLKRSLMFLTFCVSVLLTGSSTADKSEKKRGASADACLSYHACNAHYESARRLSEAGQYEAALVSYQNAFALQPVPWLLVNIGRMQQRLGRSRQAILTYQQFLRDPAAAADQESANRASTYLKQAEHEAELLKSEASPLGVTSPAVPANPHPVYKKWWFWVAIGGGALVAAGAISAGVVAANRTIHGQILSF